MAGSEEGGGARRTEEEEKWTLRVTRRLCVIEEPGKLLNRTTVSPSVQWAEYLLCVNR